MYDAVPPLNQVRPDLPASFARTVDCLLDKRPEHRPSLRSVIQTLHSLEASGSGATQTMAVRPEPPPRPRSKYRLFAAILVLVALIAALGWWARGRWLGSRLPASRQLVVLPFENLSHDPLEQAFCDGLVELLTSSLTQLERFHSTLWVIPSADVRRLQLHSVGDARKAFPVNLAVTGSLQSDEDQVLLIVNLSDATTMRQLGSRIIPVRRADRGQLASRLTSAMLELLDLGPGAGGVLRDNQPKVLSAYDSYVQAKGFVQHAEVPGSLDRAITLLEQSVKEDPDFALSQSALGDAYLRRYNATKEKEWLAKADQMLERSLELDPGQALVHLNMGRMFRATGQIDKAIAEMQRAVALDPLSVAAYTNVASAYAEARRPADAENAYLQAVRIRPSYYPAYSNLGIFYMNRAEYAKALEPLSLVVKLAPDYAEGHNNLATLFYFTERWDEALAEYGKSLAIRPTATAYSNRGAIYHFRGDYAHAKEEYRHALDLDGKSPVFWGNLGDACARIPGDEAEARQAYEHAIALSLEQLAVNPNDADLLGRMAFYLAKISNCTEARARMRESLKLAPDRVPLIFKSAKVAEACHDRQSALTYLETAIRKGYPLREIEQDPDLTQLRQSSTYRAMRPKTELEKK